MKPETPVDRDKEAKAKKQRERLRHAVIAGTLTTIALSALLALGIGHIYFLVLIYQIWGFASSLAFALFSLCVAIGIKFGYDWYYTE